VVLLVKSSPIRDASRADGVDTAEAFLRKLYWRGFLEVAELQERMADAAKLE